MFALAAAVGLFEVPLQELSHLGSALMVAAGQFGVLLQAKKHPPLPLSPPALGPFAASLNMLRLLSLYLTSLSSLDRSSWMKIEARNASNINLWALLTTS